MPAPGGAFEQSYNAQAAVNTNTMLVVATELTQATNDKQQVAPMLVTLAKLPEDLGKVTELLADAGYFSEANVTTSDMGASLVYSSASERITSKSTSAEGSTISLARRS